MKNLSELTYQEIEKEVLNGKLGTDHLLWKVVDELKFGNPKDREHLQFSLFKPINEKVMDVETKLRLLRGKSQRSE